MSNGNTTHGMSGGKFYRTWNNMKCRVTDEKHPSYKYYGGIGIKIQESWYVFENFKEDMYQEFLEMLTKFDSTKIWLERIDPSEDYCKSNCEWSIARWQSYNQRKKKASKYIGVSVREYRGRKYIATLVVGKNNTVMQSSHYTEIEAYKAYLEALKKHDKNEYTYIREKMKGILK